RIGPTILSNDYRRLYGACHIMAQQSKSPQVQARWLLLAQACLRRASVSDDTCRGTTELKCGVARASFGAPANTTAALLRMSVGPDQIGSGQHEGTDGPDCDQVPNIDSGKFTCE